MHELLFSFEIAGKTFLVSSWMLLGFTGNLLFTARVLVQWLASERCGRSIVPVAYWWLSLLAALTMLVYAFGRQEIPFILGLASSLVPYTRNLWIHYRPHRAPRSLGLLLVVATLLACLPILKFSHEAIIDAWFFLGLLGTAVFYSRFPYQWVVSERSRRSTLPLGFWYLSLAGSALLLLYSLIRADLPFFIGFIFNGIPYVRNIMILRRRHRSGCTEPTPA